MHVIREQKTMIMEHYLNFSKFMLVAIHHISFQQKKTMKRRHKKSMKKKIVVNS